MNIPELEFIILGMLCDGESYKRFENCEVIVYEDIVKISYETNSELGRQLNFKTLFTKSTTSNSTELVIRDIYKDFNNLNYVQSDDLYRRLYGYTLPSEIKCMIIFLASVTNIKDYLSKLSTKTLQQITEFIMNQGDHFYGIDSQLFQQS